MNIPFKCRNSAVSSSPGTPFLTSMASQSMQKIAVTFFAVIIITLFGVCPGHSSEEKPASKSAVTSSQLKTIESLFRENGLSGATSTLDKLGKVALGGSYRDEREVQLAFSLAMSVVGAKRIATVTRESIDVWEVGKKFSSAASGNKKNEPKPEQKAHVSGSKLGYALIVGIGKFKAGTITPLRYAADDAQRFYDYLSKDNKDRYKKENVKLLVNEQATSANIYKSLEELRDKVHQEDDVIIYFSSHGVPAFDGSMNIVAYDTEISKKRDLRLMETSIPAKLINNFLDSVDSKRVLVVYDVCYSGAAFKTTGDFSYEDSKPIDQADDNTGFSKDAMASALLGSKDIVFEDDVVKSSDKTDKDKLKVIMSASSSDEKSWESETIKGSVFTYYLLKGLESGANVKLAFAVARARVPYLVKQEKKAEQHPQVISSSNLWDNFFIGQ